MTRIIWLASYPRSGNTWMRFLLYNLHHGVPFASHQVDKFIPSFHGGITAQHFAANRPTIVKTHLQYRHDMPLNECTAGAIYIYRHPIPVMASNVRYAMRHICYEDLPIAVRRTHVERLVTAFVEKRGFPEWLDNGYGSWEDNVASWIEEDHGFPVLAVRYENFLRDPLAEVDRICDFLGLVVSATDRIAAVENTAEDKLMAMEENEIRHKWPGLFVNSAPLGSRKWRFIRDTSLEPLAELVPPSLLAQAAAAFAAPARRFGYER